MKLPKTVYVTWDESGNDDPWLHTQQTPTSYEHGQIVGIYQLTETRVVDVTTKLLPKRKGRK